MDYAVAVRELCEFTAKQGDLDVRFTPAPSAQEGIAGHGIVAGRRGAHYRREVPLEGRYRNLTLRGRADGYRADRNELEEIKTYRGDWRRIPENHHALHWAQLKLYGAMLCAERELPSLRLTLVYFEVDREEETPLSEEYTREALQAFFEAHCERFLVWADRELAHRITRNAALDRMAFPFPDFHAGQRQLAAGVFRAARDARDLLIQAPTGIGKSIGTLFPALKAMGQGHLDKVFFLTAKTPGRQLALDAAGALRTQDAALPLRVLELVARDKSCEHPDKACHGESCPLARGFYDRLPAARAEACTRTQLDQSAVREVALQHGICPYYLSQDLARWADVAVGDYHYFFDQSALLHGLTALNDWRAGVLVDEAHNLVERGRAMYSAELDQRALLALRPTASPSIRKALDRLQRAWNKTVRDQTTVYRTYPAPPPALIEAMHKVVIETGRFLAENPAALEPELQRFYFDLLNFLGRADEFAEHSIFDAQILPGRQTQPVSVLCLRNVVPAPFLQRRLATATATVAFSATLNPPDFYRDLLGFKPDTPWLDIPSPFSPDQLRVHIVDHISTRYARRGASVVPITALIATQYRQTPGNYLAFFSSFDYLQQIAARMAEAHADVPIWSQSPRMTEAERRAFLDRFTPESRGVGFAVLGGAFAEGIDLPGQRLIGAFVATLGLPQVNPVNEEMRQRMDALFGDATGYDYIYLYPGLQKVVQAAGRVIRGREDRGAVHLIDDRFGRASVQRLLPAWWSAQAPATNIEFDQPAVGIRAEARRT